jgi:ubiquinol-cytochrome c reductase cytochrome b subunit
MAGLKERGISLLTEGYGWLERRLGLIEPLTKAAEHPTPSNSASWWYVFGSAATVLLMLQVMTGILLALVYSPSANEAWGSLQVLNHNIALGWYLRALHGWGSDFMIAIVLIHMVQVFLFGAFKFPRELTWIVGVCLLLLTLGMAFTGQVMRFDQDAYWGLGIGASIASRVPFIGAPLVHLILGGPIIGGATLSRFFTLHVFVIPGLLLAGVGVHVWMVLLHGVSDWPMPGRIVRKSTYVREYQGTHGEDRHPIRSRCSVEGRGLRRRDHLLGHGLRLLLRPVWSERPPDPTIIQTAPKPDFAFLWIYSVLAFLPPSIETPVMLVVPCSPSRDAAPACLCEPGRAALEPAPGRGAHGRCHRRHAGHLHPARNLHAVEPHHGGMDQRPHPAEVSHTARRSNARALSCLQDKQCRNCHSLAGSGGLRGPALDSIATRMTEDQMIRQVLQGGGNMPAYGNALNPSETKALVSFLATLRGKDLAPAVDASRGLVHASELVSPVGAPSPAAKTP